MCVSLFSISLSILSFCLFSILLSLSLFYECSFTVHRSFSIFLDFFKPHNYISLCASVFTRPFSNCYHLKAYWDILINFFFNEGYMPSIFYVKIVLCYHVWRRQSIDLSEGCFFGKIAFILKKDATFRQTWFCWGFFLYLERKIVFLGFGRDGCEACTSVWQLPIM